MDNDFKQELFNLVFDSDLKSDQKLLWELFLKISYPDEDEAVYEAVSESEENFKLLTNHLRDKILHMKETNKQAWHKLVGDEARYADLLS